ncbi:hypothetical protein [Azotobacter beijerinckii]|uniref:Uncharacterized protein n=1 Tax=Azotobacter beijerinckii TaxID=170623 RepID=A0A1I4II53_9GAMM|nr:hypothetical protein [Azotobacter beijerinckii]SFL53683.1 hypothetical protein SAMN04244574_04600 [Azotobacter beijerinckii]
MSNTLDPARRYNLVQPGQLTYGYLEGGRFYNQEGRECGCLDGDKLISYMTLPDGTPSVAGIVEGLTVKINGATLELVPVN